MVSVQNTGYNWLNAVFILMRSQTQKNIIILNLNLTVELLRARSKVEYVWRIKPRSGLGIISRYSGKLISFKII